VLGFAVALRCIWDFVWTGHGTPAPIASPKRLVVGFYRYVRNPMYVGFAAGWIGLWVVFGHANLVAIATVLAVVLAVRLFVVFCEEPALHKKFGTDYDDCRRNVGRWWPRLRGWVRPQWPWNWPEPGSRRSDCTGQLATPHVPEADFGGVSVSSATSLTIAVTFLVTRLEIPLCRQHRNTNMVDSLRHETPTRSGTLMPLDTCSRK